MVTLPEGCEHLLEHHAARDWNGLHTAACDHLASHPELEAIELAQIAYLLARSQEGLKLGGEALANYEKAAELYADASDERPALACRLGVARIHGTTGATGLALHIAQQVCDTAIQRGWQQEQMNAQMLLGKMLNREHRYAQALILLEEVLAYHTEHGTASEHAHARRELTVARIATGVIEESIAQSHSRLAELEAAGATPEELIEELNVLVFARWCKRDFVTALELQERMLELAAQLEQPLQSMFLLYNSALSEIALSNFQQAKRKLHKAWDVARRQGDQRLIAPIQMALALVAVHCNEAGEAVRYAELARENILGFHSDENALIDYYLSLAYLAAGNPQESERDWSRRKPVKASVENGLELDWLLRAVRQLPAATVSDDETGFTARMAAELAAERARCPA